MRSKFKCSRQLLSQTLQKIMGVSFHSIMLESTLSILINASATTSDTKVYISRTTSLNNNAKTDGGLFYLGGAKIN
jgi:hypothetical protein